MSGPIQSLIVKEWHEQKWRCASLSAIGLSVVVFAMARDPGLVLGASVTTCMALACLGTAFIAMGVSASERSSSTLEIIRVLPISMKKISAVKIAVGLVICVSPILIVLTSIGAWYGLVQVLASRGHEASVVLVGTDYGMHAEIRDVWGYLIFSLSFCVSLYLWVVALGITQKSEIRAGLAGIAVLAIWFIVIVLVLWVREIAYLGYAQRNDSGLTDYMVAAVVGISPYGSFFATEMGLQEGWPIIVMQIATACLLITWVIHNFGRIMIHDNLSPKVNYTSSGILKLAGPRQTPVTAILWKQWRDTIPMAALGILLIVVITGIYLLDEVSYYSNLDVSTERARSLMEYWVIANSRTIGILLALVVGVGTFVSDYKPEALTFWRSRPINPRTWFWSKYASGLLVVELTMILPWLITKLWIGSGNYSVTAVGYIGSTFIMYWFIYTASVLMGCLLRHMIYAGVMAAGLAAAVLIPPTIEPVLSIFSVETPLIRIADQYDFVVWLISFYLPYLLWMLPPTLLALWLATRAAKRESAFVFER